jgi:hypothetical protein
LHYARQLKDGDPGPLRRKKRGNGERQPLPNGYIRIRVDGRTLDEHRFVMEQLIGRRLVKGENVHHVNGVKSDNTTDGPLVNFRSGNLELWSKSQPSGQRVADKVAWAKDLLALYDPDALAS